MLERLLYSIKTYFKKTDRVLLATAVIAALFGLLLIFSATYSMGARHYLLVQSIALVLGIVCFIVASLSDLRRFPRLWIILFVFNILFQLSLYFIGTAGDTGNKSWINYSWMPMSIQPGEIGKIIFVFTFASHINILRDRLDKPSSVIQLLIHFALTVGSVFAISRDLGVAIIYVFIFLVMFFASGVKWQWIAGVFGFCGACAPVLWHFMDDYQRLRILVVFNPEVSPKYAWHAKQSLLALGHGGFSGVGLLKGSQVQNGILFSKHADFIFASCGEELGFIACLFIIVLLSVIVIRCFLDAKKSDNLMGYLMCIGVGAMLMFQTLINVGMCLGIMPVIGITLPFFSYGGSSLLTSFAALGFVCSATIDQAPRRLV